MNTHEAIKILRNTAWLGTNEDREKAEQAIEVVAEALEQEQKRGEMTKTIDAVKVVRCRECEYWKCNPNTKDYGVCGKVSYDDFEVVMEGDDFCSFGIRKREEMTKTLFMNLYNCEKFENLSNGVVYMKIPKCSIYDEIGREWIVNCVRQDNFECCFTNAFEQVERIKGE